MKKGLFVLCIMFDMFRRS